MQIKTKIVNCHTADSKPVKQEVNGTVILPPVVFPGKGSSPATGAANERVSIPQKVYNSKLTSGSGIVVKHLPHHLKVEGLNPGTVTITGRIKITRSFKKILYWPVAVAQW